MVKLSSITVGTANLNTEIVCRNISKPLSPNTIVGSCAISISCVDAILNGVRTHDCPGLFMGVAKFYVPDTDRLSIYLSFLNLNVAACINFNTLTLSCILVIEDISNKSGTYGKIKLLVKLFCKVKIPIV